MLSNCKDLSQDQKYLLDICIGISNGKCADNLSHRSPGALNHARWLTLANRSLRLYIASSKPSKKLKDLVKFILTVYAPAWFNIKQNSSCTNGAVNLFNIIRSCRYLQGEQKMVVRRSIQHNAYYAHPENVILSMLFDKTHEFAREKAVEYLTDIRTSENGFRKFAIPELNFDATSYFGMVNFNNLEITVPPMVANFNKDTLENLYKSDVGQKISQIPCHSQAVERYVKTVSESASHVSAKQRNGVILNTLSSRAKIPKFSSKNKFVTE